MPFYDMVKFLFHFALKNYVSCLSTKDNFYVRITELLLILEFILKLSPLIGRLLVSLQQAN